MGKANLSLCCFAGPLGAALSNAYDTRVVVMTGGFLSGLGFIMASQATCLLHLYLTMGVLSGTPHRILRHLPYETLRMAICPFR